MNLKLLVSAAIGLATCTVNAQNLLNNNSFETPGPGFAVFQGWANFGNIFAADSGELAAQDGSISGKMFGASSGFQSDQVLQQTIDSSEDIVEGELYTMSAFVQNRSTDALGMENIILIQMAFQDGSGTNIEVVETRAIDLKNDPLDTWISSDVSGIAPDGTEQILVSLLHIQLGGPDGFPVQGGGASFWDNIQVVKGDAPCTNPADLDGNGVLDFFDVSAFLDAFGKGCP